MSRKRRLREKHSRQRHQTRSDRIAQIQTPQKAAVVAADDAARRHYAKPGGGPVPDEIVDAFRASRGWAR